MKHFLYTNATGNIPLGSCCCLDFQSYYLDGWIWWSFFYMVSKSWSKAWDEKSGCIFWHVIYCIKNNWMGISRSHGLYIDSCWENISSASPYMYVVVQVRGWEGWCLLSSMSRYEYILEAFHDSHMCEVLLHSRPFPFFFFFFFLPHWHSSCTTAARTAYRWFVAASALFSV